MTSRTDTRKKPEGTDRRRAFPGRWIRGQRGMALMTVLVLSFVFVIGTLAFFAVAAYEAGQAEVRENSTRAFYLADGAIERAKVELLRDGRWTGGFGLTSLDGGRFRLAVSDTIYQGETRTRFYAEGMVGRTKRDVEVVANIVPVGPVLAMLAMHDVELKGNICLDGHLHANGTLTGSGHLSCGGTSDSQYPIIPPAVYTEPDSYPGATYYYVTVRSGPKDTLVILDRNRATLSSYVKGTTTPTPHPHIDWSYTKGTKTLQFDVKPTDAFDQVSGPFPRLGADSTVVINFGGLANSAHLLTDMTIHETGSSVIESTIINTRFTGISTADRVDHDMWTGGKIETKTKAVFVPRYCIALICQEIHGNAQVTLGTDADPALTYVMALVDASTGQWTVVGSLICLWDIDVGGGVNLTYRHAFISCLPPYLEYNWPAGTSGLMQVLLWREPPPRAF